MPFNLHLQCLREALTPRATLSVAAPSPLLIFGSMLSSLQDDAPLEPLLRARAHGFQMGLDAELVVSRKLEEGWDRPLKDWREELKLPLETED